MRILFVQSESESLSTELLSGYLKKNGHDVHLFFDPKLFSSSIISNNYLGKAFDIRKVLLRRIRDLNPDIIAFSVMTGDYQWALNTASVIKSQAYDNEGKAEVRQRTAVAHESGKAMSKALIPDWRDMDTSMDY